jgi:hypothetical protein
MIKTLGAQIQRYYIIISFKTDPYRTVECEGEITSITLRGDGHMFYVGTSKSQIYRMTLADWKLELLNTCHNSVINDIAFPL